MSKQDVPLPRARPSENDWISFNSDLPRVPGSHTNWIAPLQIPGLTSVSTYMPSFGWGTALIVLIAAGLLLRMAGKIWKKFGGSSGQA